LKPTTILFRLFIFAAFTIFFAGCANPVSPGGGPKDVTSPSVVKSDPPNYSLNFDKSVISITFDEFVKLKNPNQQVIISPPLDEQPEFKLRGKSVVIDLKSASSKTQPTQFFLGALLLILPRITR